MNKFLLGAVVALLGLLMLSPLAFARGGGHRGGGHRGGGHARMHRGTHQANRRGRATTRRTAKARGRSKVKSKGNRRHQGRHRHRHRRHRGMGNNGGGGGDDSGGGGGGDDGGGGGGDDGGSSAGGGDDGGGSSGGGAEDDGDVGEGSIPTQTTRYLLVRNQTGQTLTVYAQTDADAKPRAWEFAPGESAYLAVAPGKKLAADEVMVWARSAGKNWDQYKDEALVLVPEEEYESATVQTFTHTFNP